MAGLRVFAPPFALAVSTAHAPSNTLAELIFSMGIKRRCSRWQLLVEGIIRAQWDCFYQRSLSEQAF